MKALVIAAALLAFGTGMAVAQGQPAQLPNGASSVQETYQDWRVACAQTAPAHSCTLSQTQARQNGQMVLAVELSATADNGLTGSLVLPFGLSLQAGAALQIDDGQPKAALPFSTCYQVGCVVPLSFDQTTLAALRKGKVLKVNVTALNASQPTTLQISLKGFSPALDRTMTLAH